MALCTAAFSRSTLHPLQDPLLHIWLFAPSAGSIAALAAPAPWNRQKYIINQAALQNLSAYTKKMRACRNDNSRFSEKLIFVKCPFVILFSGNVVRDLSVSVKSKFGKYPFGETHSDIALESCQTDCLDMLTNCQEYALDIQTGSLYSGTNCKPIQSDSLDSRRTIYAGNQRI